jgi:hypothetical protein
MVDETDNPNSSEDNSQKPKRPYTRRAAADAAPAAEAYTEQVTYLPGEGDNPSIKWGGITLHANVPKELEAHAEGTPQQRLMHGLIERARTNKFFHVGEFDAKNAVATQEQFAQPKTPEQYRAHVVRWLPNVMSEGELDHKWMSEEPLRQACGVGADDLDWLSTFIAPKRHELHKQGQA